MYYSDYYQTPQDTGYGQQPQNPYSPSNRVSANTGYASPNSIQTAPMLASSLSYRAPQGVRGKLPDITERIRGTAGETDYGIAPGIKYGPQDGYTPTDRRFAQPGYQPSSGGSVTYSDPNDIYTPYQRGRERRRKQKYGYQAPQRSGSADGYQIPVNSGYAIGY